MFWKPSEAVVRRCSDKKIFLNISQNSQENTAPATLLQNRLWHRCFPVNLAKFLRTPFVIEHLRCLPPNRYKSCNLYFPHFVGQLYFEVHVDITYIALDYTEIYDDLISWSNADHENVLCYRFLFKYLLYIYDAVHWIKLDINLLQFCGLNIVVWIVRNILILASKS